MLPVKVVVKLAPVLAHLLVPPMNWEPVSSVQPEPNWKAELVMSSTSMPSGAAPGSWKPLLALYTPTSLSMGTFPSGTVTVMRTWSPLTTPVRHSRLPPMVWPEASSCH